jgi:hypothetical protein
MPRYRTADCDRSRCIRTSRSNCFYALGIGLGFVTIISRWGAQPTFVFLCPRCRAGGCDGCFPDGPLTCGFDAHCADRSQRRSFTGALYRGHGLGQRTGVRAPYPGRRRGCALWTCQAANQPVTCIRVLPGSGVTTSALAAIKPMTTLGRGQSFMGSGEREARRATPPGRSRRPRCGTSVRTLRLAGSGRIRRPRTRRRRLPVDS